MIICLSINIFVSNKLINLMHLKNTKIKKQKRAIINQSNRNPVALKAAWGFFILTQSERTLQALQGKVVYFLIPLIMLAHKLHVWNLCFCIACFYLIWLKQLHNLKILELRIGYHVKTHFFPFIKVNALKLIEGKKLIKLKVIG